MTARHSRTSRRICRGCRPASLNGATAYWMSRIDASHFDMATAYVAVDGHRSDDLKPYIFVTHDYGKTFQNIAGTLPQYGNVQVVKEDPKNKNLLYAGTEFGMFISLDAGTHWEKFMTNYPTVRTDDILDSSARRRRDRRDARAESVDRGRRHAAATVHAGGRVRGRALVRRAERDRVSVRLQDGRGRRRRSPLRGRECSARDGDQLLLEVGRDGSRSRSRS